MYNIKRPKPNIIRKKHSVVNDQKQQTQTQYLHLTIAEILNNQSKDESYLHFSHSNKKYISKHSSYQQKNQTLSRII
jgi:hypothetical protein